MELAIRPFRTLAGKITQLSIMKRLLLTVLLAAIPIGLLQAISVNDEHREEQAEVREKAAGVAQWAAAEQARISDGARQLLAALAQMPAVRDGDAESCNLIMRRLQAKFEIYTAIGVANTSGQIWCGSGRTGVSIADRPYFHETIASRAFTTGGFIVGRETGRRTLNFSLPVLDDQGRLLGIITAGLDLNLLAAELARAPVPDATSIAIFDRNRNLLIGLHGPHAGSSTLPAQFDDAFASSEPGILEADWLDGSDRLVAFVPPAATPNAPFFVAVGIDRSGVMREIAWQAWEALSLLFAVLSSTLLIAWWFAGRYVRRPLKRLANTVGSWRSGDNQARVGPLHPGSEFDDLARAFDALADEIVERQRHLTDALESTTDAVTSIDPDWTITYVNQRAIDRIGDRKIVGLSLWNAFPEVVENPLLTSALKTAMIERRPSVISFQLSTLGGQFETNIFPANDGGLITFSRDVSAQHRAQEDLRHLAHFDPLTSLPNRTHAMEIARARSAAGELSAMLLLDLDSFKHVNDSFGHLAGDEMLRAVARRLETALGRDGIVARLGGDEFVVLLLNQPCRRCAEIGERLLVALERDPFLIRGRIHHSSSSCGLVLVDTGAGEADVEGLMANADIALYRAKEAGGGTVRTYDVADRDAYEARRQLETEVTEAATSGQFELYYQPQVRLEDGAIVGAEALLRWRHPERGLLAPEAFIAVLGSSRHAVPVGSWIIEEACRQAARWWRRGKRLRISVNVFSQQMRSSDLTSVVQDALRRHNLPAEALELELTENIALAAEEGVKGVLQTLRLLGVRLAFDDFGTGFASLTTLKDLPVNRIKIDRAFVTHLPWNEQDKAIVEAVLALARTLDMEIVAEGVETLEQEEYLKSRGCQEAQGYRYSPPLPAREFDALILAAADKRASA